MSKELWEQGFNLNITNQEVKRIRKKRVTKGDLVKSYQKRGGNMSPKIDTEVREGADDVSEGVPYEIVNVEDVETEVQNLSGIRVSLLTVKAQEGNVLLWKRRITGTGSKLGVFITLLGNNSDNWLHKWVVFDTWRERNRVMREVEAPASRKAKAKAKK